MPVNFTHHLSLARQDERDKCKEELREMIEGKRKKMELICSCGGDLVDSWGTGKVMFPLQCKKCNSYTDYPDSDYNQALDDLKEFLTK